MAVSGKGSRKCTVSSLHLGRCNNRQQNPQLNRHFYQGGIVTLRVDALRPKNAEAQPLIWD